MAENQCPQTTQREAFITTLFARRVKMEGNWKIIPLKLKKVIKGLVLTASIRLKPLLLTQAITLTHCKDLTESYLIYMSENN